MQNSIYIINKGINKSIEFKGLRAQYIWYLGGGLVALLILFSILFFIGMNTYFSLVIIVVLGALLVAKIYDMSRKYGEYGLMKLLAKRRIPKVIKCNSRTLYLNLLIKQK